MKLRQPLAALSLALLAGTAFAATPSTPSASPTSKAAHAKAKTVHCKKGETAVQGKCEKAKPQG